MTQNVYSEQMTPDPLATSDELKESVALWLQEMTRGLPIGRFRFCRRRGFVPTDGPEGQVSTCFAVKIAWHIGAWIDWQADTQEACIRFIQSFQTTEGNFVDEWLLRNLDVAPRLAALKRLRIVNDRLRGEPSPSLSTLLDATFDEASQFLDERTGTWGLGAISPVQRINGAMKMLTACRWANRQHPTQKTWSISRSTTLRVPTAVAFWTGCLSCAMPA